MRIYLIIVLAALFSCKSDQPKPLSPATDKTAEITEIYNVQVKNGEHAIGKLRYKEHNEYHGDQLYGTIYYTPEGEVKGKSILLYEDGDLPVGAHYVNDQDEVQSYYKYLYDDRGRKKQVIAFDPVNNEILREERFFYDSKDNLKSKQIFDSEGKLRQRFNWTYDAFGNEKMMMADHGDNTPLMTHEYKITRYNDDKQWLEKWSFINDEPAAYYKISRK